MIASVEITKGFKWGPLKVIPLYVLNQVTIFLQTK